MGSTGPQGPTGLLGNSLANTVQFLSGGYLYLGTTSALGTSGQYSGMFMGTTGASTYGFRIGSTTSYMFFDSNVGEITLAGNVKTATGTGTRMEITRSNNSLAFYNASNVKSVQIGSTEIGGCSVFSKTTDGIAAEFHSESFMGVWAQSTTGYGMYASGNYGVQAYGNTFAFYATTGSSSTNIALVWNGVSFSGSATIHTFSGASYGPFTGAHDAIIALAAAPVTGDVVCDKHVWVKASVSDTLSEVELCAVVRDPRVLGVVANVLPVDTSHIPNSCGNSSEVITFLQDYNLLVVNASGEGQINVCRDGGDIGIGDYLTTSGRLGKGMKQDDDLQHSYTVAKAREVCSWAEGEDDIRMIACTYHAG